MFFSSFTSCYAFTHFTERGRVFDQTVQHNDIGCTVFNLNSPQLPQWIDCTSNGPRSGALKDDFLEMLITSSNREAYQMPPQVTFRQFPAVDYLFLALVSGDDQGEVT